MPISIKARYEKGKVILTDAPPIAEDVDVTVVFPDDVNNAEYVPPTSPRKLGSLKGKIVVPDDFNEPLDDLKDYM